MAKLMMTDGKKTVTFERQADGSIAYTDVDGTLEVLMGWQHMDKQSSLKKAGFKRLYDKPAKDTSLPNCTLVTFAVGDGVHWGFNGDAYPGTVRRVSKSGRKVWVSKDTYRATKAEQERVAKHGPHEGDKDMIFIPQDVPESEWVEYRLNVYGHFVDSKRSGRSSAWSLQPGRCYSQNPSF